MSTTTPIAAAHSELGASFAGQMIGPADADYDEARARLQRDDRQAAGADRALRRPRTTCRASIGFARAHDLPLAVRGGGHNGGGLGSVRRRRRRRPLAAARTSRRSRRPHRPRRRRLHLGRGRPRDAAHGLAVPCGIISTTGVGGLTLGGGIGHLTRRLRADDRQPAGGRGGARRRPAGDARARTRTPTCSGRSAAAAATSASSRRSCSGCTRSDGRRRADVLADRGGRGRAARRTASSSRAPRAS